MILSTTMQSSLNAAIMQSSDLDGLLAAVLLAEGKVKDHNDEGGAHLKLTDFVDLSDLPTFGGECPEEGEVWSWDEGRMLTARPWEIDPIED